MSSYETTGSDDFHPDFLSLESFAEFERFVCWREVYRKGRKTKIPYAPKSGAAAQSNNPETWANRAAAELALKKWNAAGVGIMLGDLGDGFHLCGIDLDSCIVGGELTDEAADVVAVFRTSTEISPSSTGLKLYFLMRSSDRFSLGEKHRFAFTKGEHREMALDVGGRYYAITDNAWDDIVGERPLRIVGIDDVTWFLNEAGPAFVGRAGKKSYDTSGSGVLYRLAVKYKLSGRTKEEFIAAIDGEPDAAAHVAKAGDRAIDRAWANAPSPRSHFDFDDDIDDLVGAPPADEITARLNERFAIVRHSGRTYAVEFTKDGFELGTVDDVHKYCLNDLVPTADGRRVQPSSRHWISNPRRRDYSGIVFDPTGSAPRNVLNFWKGWLTCPDPDARCELILQHIYEVLANGNAAYASYIIGWLADIFQNPGRKPGVALVFKGGKGAGKDTLVVALRRIIGAQHVAHVTRPDALTSRFNAPFAKAILAHVEEAFWAGANDKKGTLQSLITAESLPIEKKGIDPVTVDSYLRMVMTTNESWAVPASHDERRYAVFDVSDKHIGDRGYFEALYAEIDGEGPAGFLAYLLSVDLSDFSVREVPQTNALRNQKLNTLRGIDRWWFELLHKGDIESFKTWTDEITVLREDVRQLYESFIRDNRHQGDAINATQFGIEFKKMVPELRVSRPRVERKSGPRSYILPSLSRCRTLFSMYMRSDIDWEA